MKRVTRDEFRKIMTDEGTTFLETLVNDDTSIEQHIMFVMALAVLSSRLEKRLFS